MSCTVNVLCYKSKYVTKMNKYIILSLGFIFLCISCTREVISDIPDENNPSQPIKSRSRLHIKITSPFSGRTGDIEFRDVFNFYYGLKSKYYLQKESKIVKNHKLSMRLETSISRHFSASFEYLSDSYTFRANVRELSATQTQYNSQYSCMLRPIFAQATKKSI